MRSSLKPAWIAIALLALLFTVTAVQACMPAPHQEAATTPAISGEPAGSLHLQYFTQKSSCTREAMDQCEYACMMPGGILDLYCYEDCIYSIC